MRSTGKLLSNHASLWAEVLQQLTHDTAYCPFVARIAKEAERRQLDAGVWGLRQGCYASAPGPSTGVTSRVGQAEMLKHHRN